MSAAVTLGLRLATMGVASLLGLGMFAGPLAAVLPDFSTMTAYAVAAAVTVTGLLLTR